MRDSCAAVVEELIFSFNELKVILFLYTMESVLVPVLSTARKESATNQEHPITFHEEVLILLSPLYDE